MSSKLPIDTNRRSTIQSYGFVIGAWTFLHNRAAQPVSPFLIQLAVQGKQAFLLDDDYLNRLHPRAMETIQCWSDWKKSVPRSSLLSLGPTDPLFLVLNEAGIRVCLFSATHQPVEITNCCIGEHTARDCDGRAHHRNREQAFAPYTPWRCRHRRDPRVQSVLRWFECWYESTAMGGCTYG